MPKQTFLNLPDKKRERFVLAAMEEFARHPYDVASVSAIVARLRIAKGSVYQYFDDKFDLFQWLLEESARRTVASLDTPDLVGVSDPFERLRILYAAGLGLWRDQPLWQRMNLRVIEPSKEPRIADLRERQKGLAHAFMLDLITTGRRDGYVRDDLDLPTAARLLTGMLQQGLLDALFARSGIDYTHLPDDPAEFARIPEQVILEVVDTALDLLRASLAPRSPAPGG